MPPEDPLTPSPPDPSTGARESVDPTTRLVMARLASGATRLADDPHGPRAARRRALGLGSLFPLPPTDPAKPTRLEMAALAGALVVAAALGAALPHAQPVQAQALARPVQVAAAPAAAPLPGPTPVPTDAPVADDSTSADTTADGSDAAALAAPTTIDSSSSGSSSSSEESATSDPSSGSSSDTSSTDGSAPADGSDPLAGGAGDHLAQVALVIVHGDAPGLWAKAAAGTPARKRAALGATLTGFAQVPGAPLASELGLIAGQQVNPATRAGCDVPTPLVPGTIDAMGRVAGAGCDYPAGTPSLPSAIAIDGRRWKAYAPLAADQAPAALCGTGTPAGDAALYARTSALRRLADLQTSGACASAAAPLTDLPKDLAADEPPAWLVIEIGACAPTGCTADQAVARDRDLDGTIATLTAKKGMGTSSAVLVVGDGAGPVDGLTAPDAGTAPFPTSPDDPAAPAALETGALLLGPAVAADTTDPIALTPFSIAKTQATWLGVDAPAWGGAEGTASLAVPSS